MCGLSLLDLSTELLILIFQQLLEIDQRSAVIARSVCRRFNDIATPSIYRTISLNEKIISDEAEVLYPEALQNIFRYTRHLNVRSNLEPYGTKRILDKTRNLRRVTWRYVRINERGVWPWRPYEVFSVDDVRHSRISLCIEDLPLRHGSAVIPKTYTESMPAGRLVSLRMSTPHPPLSTQLGPLKDLLVQAHSLETFHYKDRGQGTHFNLAGTERLPAFRELHLESYDWNHDSSQVQAHWDFSQIRCLELISMPTHPFLASVCFSDFGRLHTLRVEDFSAHHHYHREEATSLLHNLVRDHIRALATLDLEVHLPLFPIDALLRHSPSLQVLRLHDHAGFGDENLRCPTVSVNDLSLLSESLAHVHTLELDMDTHLVSTNLFLRALCVFPKLHTLTLRVHTLLNPHDSTSPAADRDREFAYRIFWFLVQAKRTTTPDVSWKSITINVGGWQQVMVRRLSEAWKALNQMGVFAERCFVLERVDGGGYRTGEEFGGGLFLGSSWSDRGGGGDVDMV